MAKIQLNHRAYAMYHRIAESALEAIKQLDNCVRPELNCTCCKSTSFQKQDLILICFDYAFSALENFLEHIGYILFPDWDSNGKHKHYSKKLEKLRDFSGCLAGTRQRTILWEGNAMTVNYEELASEWGNILEIISPNFTRELAEKRNPIKHSHTGTHEIKTHEEPSIVRFSDFIDALNASTPLGILESDCTKLLDEFRSFVEKMHDFLKKYKLIFGVYHKHGINADNRKTLFRTFLNNPFAQTMYVGEGFISN